MIYEGANGIQALDLVGRKLSRDEGRALRSLFEEITTYIAEHRAEPMASYVGPLAAALDRLREATAWLMQNAPTHPDNAAAGASEYLNLLGLVALAYMWCRMVEAANTKIVAEGGAAEPLRAKLTTARFFMERLLPETAAQLARIQAGAGSVMELPAEAF
jgi:acyl-CoA dehydrogenase